MYYDGCLMDILFEHERILDNGNIETIYSCYRYVIGYVYTGVMMFL